MTDFGVALDAMTVTVTSPDGNITARLSRRDRVTVAFRAGSYAEYDAADLARQLGRLLRLLEVGRLRGWRAARSQTGIEAVDHGGTHWDPRRRRYRAAIAELVSEGVSVTELITITAPGFHDFEVHIDQSAFDGVGESEFLAEFAEAVDDLISDRRAQLRRLKAEHFTPANIESIRRMR